MTTPNYSATQPGLVQHLRSIRDQLSHEIKDMTFEQERGYLDQLLTETPVADDQQRLAKSGAVE